MIKVILSLIYYMRMYYFWDKIKESHNLKIWNNFIHLKVHHLCHFLSNKLLSLFYVFVYSFSLNSYALFNLLHGKAMSCSFFLSENVVKTRKSKGL